MIKGMTGFGSAEVIRKKVKAVVEIKTVNHRYIDINYFLPIGFASLESKIRQLLQKNLKRGRVTVFVKIINKPDKSISMNKAVVKSYLKNINTLVKEFKLENNLKVSDIIQLTGVLEVTDTLVRPEDLWVELEKCLKRSLKSVVLMRKQEGKSLFEDISGQLKRMLLQINKINKRTILILKKAKERLTDEEFKSFQKNIDVNEELSRLSHYIDEMKKLLKGIGAQGKRIDFIAQEMQRETNTIGSKVQDKSVSSSVIALKSKIEKIREQAQNVE